ncbi:hypothetical protein FA95DRAFT_1367785 [Auriscalpium vulgare]|uniref:Uncharacterized protein n=1 Tax=Auriscalpium vulgare TaxID=40419 RepID=A0ACB8RRP0_9AGAM|nr:hypothetical protein FA95DRAFT_1367785 [Auriscalpium vulgare]
MSGFVGIRKHTHIRRVHLRYRVASIQPPTLSRQCSKSLHIRGMRSHPQLLCIRKGPCAQMRSQIQSTPITLPLAVHTRVFAFTASCYWPPLSEITASIQGAAVNWPGLVYPHFEATSREQLRDFLCKLRHADAPTFPLLFLPIPWSIVIYTIACSCAPSQAALSSHVAEADDWL